MSNPDEDTAVVQAVAGFFTAVEKGAWNTVRAALADRIAVAHADDLQSLSGELLASQWQQSHAGFATTRYRLQPVHIAGSSDSVWCWSSTVTATVPPSKPTQPPTTVRTRLDREGGPSPLHPNTAASHAAMRRSPPRTARRQHPATPHSIDASRPLTPTPASQRWATPRETTALPTGGRG